MDAIDELYGRAYAALRTVAGEISLEDMLLELRRFYREAQHDEAAGGNPDYEHICNVAVRALDAALWRLESAEIDGGNHGASPSNG